MLLGRSLQPAGVQMGGRSAVVMSPRMGAAMLVCSYPYAANSNAAVVQCNASCCYCCCPMYSDQGCGGWRCSPCDQQQYCWGPAQDLLLVLLVILVQHVMCKVWRSFLRTMSGSARTARQDLQCMIAGVWSPVQGLLPLLVGVAVVYIWAKVSEVSAASPRLKTSGVLLV